MNEIVIYENGDVDLKVSVENESIWLNQKQMSELFGKSTKTISEHIGNIFKEGELEKNSVIRNFRTTASDGKIYDVIHYNLDVIISVGYRVKSKEGTKFRIWATKILKEYMIKGYALNQKKLQKTKLQELDKTIQLIKQGLKNQELNVQEAKGFVEIVTDYAKSWALLQGYDEQSLEEIIETKEQKLKEAIAELKKTLISKGEATELFGNEKAGEFKGNLLNIYQSFGGVELLESVEQKAANLLYYVIKGHPFSDGNKRIGAYLFVLFLDKNGILYKSNGEPKINDNALASIALLVASSLPEQKDIIIKLIMNIIYEGDI